MDAYRKVGAIVKGITLTLYNPILPHGGDEYPIRPGSTESLLYPGLSSRSRTRASPVDPDRISQDIDRWPEFIRSISDAPRP